MGKPTKTELKYATFVRLYLGNGANGTEAAKGAGYAPRTAHVTASQLLKNPKVKKMMEEAKAAVVEKLDRTNIEIHNAIDRMAFHDIRPMYDDNNCLKPMKDLTFEDQMILNKVKYKELFEPNEDGDMEQVGNMVEVGKVDRLACLRASAQIRGMNITKLEVHDHRDLGKEMAAAQERAKEAK